jgi:tetratricopeptide (TPR) repeat protein
MRRVGRFRKYLSGRLLLIAGLISFLGAAVFSILSIVSDAASATACLFMAVVLVTLALLALFSAPHVESANLIERARWLIQDGQFEAALSRLNRAAQLSPRRAETYTMRSAAYAGMGQLDLAVEDAGRAVQIAPRQPGPRLTRARLYSYQGLYEEAIDDLRTAIREKPDWTAGYLELAQLHIKMQDYDSSLATLRDLSLQTKSEETRYESLMMAGWVYEEKLKDLDGAIATYTRAIPILPDRKIGYLRRAYAYRTRGDLYQAAEDLLRAAQRAPTPEDDGQYHSLRAVCYGRRYTITGDERDLAAWIDALEQSVREDAPSFSEQSRQWLQMIRESRDGAVRSLMGRPPTSEIFPN